MATRAYNEAIERELGIDNLICTIEAPTIESFNEICANDKIGLLHNADDIILGPGDLEFLERIFGARAVILPNGGHLGNIEHRYVVAVISKFFRS